MANTKGTGVTFLRQLVRKNFQHREEALLALLNEEERAYYNNTQQESWIPIEISAALSTKAASLLYPEQSKPHQKLGNELAKKHLTGIYKLLTKLSSAPYAMDKAAQLWSYYHKKGTNYIIQGDRKGSATSIIQGYPDIPDCVLEMTAGFLIGLMEINGAKDIQVSIDRSNPEHWEFHVSWQ